MKRTAWTTAATSVVLLSFTACSTTATVQRSNGPAYEATIASSDSGAVYVRADNGQTYRVPRAEVVDLDHPGNVLVAVGLSLVAFGALIGYAVRHDTMPGEVPPSVGEATFIGAIYALPGAALAAYGGATYWSSRNNARAFGDPVAAPLMAPPTQAYPPPGYAYPPPGYAYPPPYGWPPPPPAGTPPAPAPPAGTPPAPAPPPPAETPPAPAP